MQLANGVHYLAIPGPSVMPDAVLRAMHRPAPNIYTGELHELVDSLIPDLKTVAQTSGDVAIYIANGHGAWEAALCNVLSRGDKVLSLATGIFAHGWSDMAQDLGVEVERIDFGRRNPIDLDAFEAALLADKDHSFKAVLAVQVDTSTSVRNDIRAMREVLDAVGHPALLMVDCIACLGCDVFRMDDWGVDVMVTGSQKGLMTPPGLAFVFFNEKADKARDSADLVTRYWDWRPRSGAEQFYMYFCGTAPTHHLYGLRAALDILHAEGLETVWARHERLAQGVWAAIDTWGGNEGQIGLNIEDPTRRSHAVTSVRMSKPNGKRLQDWVSANAGLTLGIGLGMATDEDPLSEGFFRIGHMGHLNAQMLLGALGAIQTGLAALDIPHDPAGLAAATKVLAQP